jgi:Na+-driven multidrug efflux pump
MPEAGESGRLRDSVGYRNVLSLSKLAILNDAAPYAAACVETALLGHSGATTGASTARLAAFAATAASIAFASNLFNFLTTVVMARVGQALGGRRWRALGQEVRAAAGTALVLGGCCAALLFACEDALLGGSASGGGLFALSAEARAAAAPLYRLRLCAIPCLFAQRVSSGLLGGFQRIEALTAVNLGAAAVELGGVWWALRGDGGGGEDDSEAALRRCGWAFVASSAFGAGLSAALVLALPPAEARGKLRMLPRCCGGTDGGDGEEAVGDGGGGGGGGGSGASAALGEEKGGEAGVGAECERASSSSPSSSSSSSSFSSSSFSACSFLRDSSAMMGRSLFLQGSVFAMAAVASQLDRDAETPGGGGGDGGAVLAAHSIAMQLWMLESNVVDGFADVGTMLGSKMLGALAELQAAGGGTAAAAQQQQRELGAALRTLTNRVLLLSLATGLGCSVALGAAPTAVQGAFSTDPAVLAHLRRVWPLLCAMQVPNAGVFAYDGFIAATRSFAWARNVIGVGVVLLLAPGLALTVSTFRTLLALWCSKAALNAWRLLAAFVLIHVQFWRRWGGGSPLCCGSGTAGKEEKKGGAALGSPLLPHD